jgi:O-antigen ligase
MDGEAALPRPTFGFVYLLAVPIAAGLGTVEGLTIAGFNYTGFLWLLFLLAGGLVILTEKTQPGGSRICFPMGPWLLWVGYVGLSLCWCEPLSLRSFQDALQISMPLVVGVVGALCVRSEEQLDQLLRVFGPAVLLLGLSLAAMRLGLFGDLGLEATPRSLGLTAALAGCVFLARCPQQLIIPVLGWAFCVGLTVLTGSRMATFTLLLIPALHPLYRSVVGQGAALAATAALAIALFYTPIFQERFFYEGSGTLADVLEGDFLTFGRFEAWPDIWEEAWRHPYLGAGVGAAHSYVPTVWDDMAHVHNDYLRVFFDLGLVGVVLLVSVLLWQLCTLRGQIKRSRGSVRTAMAASWLGLVVFMISAITDNTLSYNLWYMNPLFAVMGAAYGAAGHCGEETPTAPPEATLSDPMPAPGQQPAS